MRFVVAKINEAIKIKKSKTTKDYVEIQMCNMCTFSSGDFDITVIGIHH